MISTKKCHYESSSLQIGMGRTDVRKDVLETTKL